MCFLVINKKAKFSQLAQFVQIICSYSTLVLEISATYSSPGSECAHGVTGKRGATRQNALSGAEQRTAPLTHTGAHKARRTTPASGTTITFSVLHSEPQQTANKNKQSFIRDFFVN